MRTPPSIRISMSYDQWAKLAESAEEFARTHDDAWLMEIAADLSECIGNSMIAACLRDETIRAQGSSGSRA